MGSIRVLLAEDHTVVRQGLRRILQAEPGIEIVAEVGDGRAALQEIEATQPSVAIVDISLPSLNGIEVTRQAAKVAPQTRILILSMHADDAYIRQALQAGARGYLLKDADDLDLLKAVAAIDGGASYFSPTVSRVLLQGFLQDAPAAADEMSVLSARERQVLPLIAEGRSSKEVAQLLGLSVSTVESHRKHIMEKLDLHNTAALVRFALKKGLVQ